MRKPTQSGFVRQVRNTAPKGGKTKHVQSTPIHTYERPPSPPLLPEVDLDADLLIPPPEVIPNGPYSKNPPGKAKKAVASVTNLIRSWLGSQRQSWAERFIQATESFNTEDLCCDLCNPEDCIYRCEECRGPRFSKQCLLREHLYTPLHRISAQDQGAGTAFQAVQLSELGLVVQLNHRRSGCCRSQPFARDFSVIHTNGVHDVKIAYCGCRTHLLGNDRVSQLFRQRWMPATWNAPRTVFTFEVLNTFHILNLQSKCNLYDYYSTITRQKNNADLDHVPNKYNEFSFVVRVWRHLKQLKRAGRIHDPAGVMQMDPGALTTRCPACPDPDRNLPDGWDHAEPEDEWLYEKIFALDACFKLSLKNNGKKGSDDDPEVASGFGVFVNEDDYRTFLRSVEHIPEESVPTCGTQFHAVNDANTRPATKTVTSGRKVTGVAGIKCARHAVVERVGDLAYGERFLWIDYIVLDALRSTKLKRCAFTYDIYCKWRIHLADRVRKYFSPEMAESFSKLQIRGFVPKLHLYAHGASCQTIWSLNYHQGVGRTDGESTERDWAAAVLAALQTAEMNPGARHAALDDHWIDRNFRRVVGLKNLLLKWLKNALKWSNIQRDTVRDLERGYEASIIQSWKKMVYQWNADHRKPDPYEEPEANDASRKLRSEFKADEAKRNADAAKIGRPPPDIAILGSFLSMGRSLHQRQYELKAWIKNQPKMKGPELTALQNKRTSLQCDIYQWSIAQGEYMPHIKWARLQNDFSFLALHGQPPPGDLMYVVGDMSPFSQSPPLQSISTPSAQYPSIDSNHQPPTTTASSSTGKSTKRKRGQRVVNTADSGIETDVVSLGPTNSLMDVDNAENINLWLPSDIPSSARLMVCSQGAVDAEFNLLQAELHDSLVTVRKYQRLHCLVRSSYRGEYRAGSQSATRTRKRKEITTVGEKIEAAKLRYQRAWVAAVVLYPDGLWLTRYQKLEQKDIRGPNPQDDLTDLAAVGGQGTRPRTLGTGTYVQSWIWRTVTAADDPVDQVRVQWAKANANAERWEEELRLVPEEMRRTLASFEWQQAWWLKQIGRRSDFWIAPELSLALDTYAQRQAGIYAKRILAFTRAWSPVLVRAKLGRDWLPRHLVRMVAYDAATLARARVSSAGLGGPDKLDDIGNVGGVEDDICNFVEDGGASLWKDPTPESAVPDLYEVDSDDEQAGVSAVNTDDGHSSADDE